LSVALASDFEGAGNKDVVVTAIHRMSSGRARSAIPRRDGRAPIPLQLVPLTTDPSIDPGEFARFCFPVHHRDTDSFGFSFESAASRHPPEGQKIVIVGDTEIVEGLAEHVRGADVLVIEATFLDRDGGCSRRDGRWRVLWRVKILVACLRCGAGRVAYPCSTSWPLRHQRDGSSE
jgi:hypothetical protein